MEERLYMSNIRKAQLDSRYSGETEPIEKTLKYKLEAEERFGNYLFVPLDIPVIKDDLFVEWYWENAKPVKKIIPDIATQRKDLESFVSVDVAEEGSWVLNLNQVWSSNFRTDFSKLFPKLVEQIYEYFPIRIMDSYSIWSSIEPVGPHRDRSVFLDFPSSLRIMLHDENPAPTLYVEEYKSDSIFPVAGTKKYVPKLDDTNSFAWNNLRTKHGSDHTPVKEKYY